MLTKMSENQEVVMWRVNKMPICSELSKIQEVK